MSYKVRPLRSVQSITLEDVSLTVIWYGLFALYCLQWIPLSVLVSLTLVYVERVFTIRHEKSHLRNYSKHRWIGFLDNYFVIYHTPYQEPISQKQRKHLSHHKSNKLEKLGIAVSKTEDPHQVLEQGNLFKIILANTFYEEVMFYYDLKRSKKLDSSRLKMMIASILGITLTIYVVGWVNYCTLFFCYRTCMALVWFVFSYVLHRPIIYEKSENLFKKTPTWVYKMNEWILGSSNSTVVFFHKHHHENPQKYFRF